MKPVAMIPLALALAGCSLAPTHERTAAPVPAQYDTPAQPGWLPRPRTGAPISTTRRCRPGSRPRWPTTATCGWRRCVRRARCTACSSPNACRPSTPAANSAAAAPPSRASCARRCPGYRAAVGITAFELDFFGRVRKSADAALARYLASEVLHRAATLALVAETATAYFKFSVPWPNSRA